MHVHNAVLLVWGSLRLPPMMQYYSSKFIDYFKPEGRDVPHYGNVGDLCCEHLQLIIATEHGRCGSGVKWSEQY